jgi:hypothetical protein
VIEPAALHELLHRWWWSYDEGHFDVLQSLIAPDIHFTCRTDTGTTDFEEFVRADVRGTADFMAWQSEHRANSPYPLRHNGTNAHIVHDDGDRATFASYIFVTQMVAGAVSNLSTAVVHGAVVATDAGLRLAELHVVLDTMDSVVFSEVRELRS